MECCTFIHLIEKDFGVDYRFEKKFSGSVIENGLKKKKTYSYFVRYLDRNVNTSLKRFEQLLMEKRKLKREYLGEGFIQWVHTKDLYQIGLETLSTEARYFLKG